MRVSGWRVQGMRMSGCRMERRVTESKQSRTKGLTNRVLDLHLILPVQHCLHCAL